MSGTVAGAVKARIESGGFQLAAYRDLPPDGTKLPYAVVFEGIARPLEPTGDTGSAGSQLEVREEVQVDVWQAKVDPTTRGQLEDPDLPLKVARRLHGAALQNVGTGRVYPVVVRSVQRVPNPEKNLVRDTITLSVLRQIGAPL